MAFRIVTVLLGVCALGFSVIGANVASAQTNYPDYFLPEYSGVSSTPTTWIGRDGCSVFTHPMPAPNGRYENYIVKENFDYGSVMSAKNRRTIVTATGGVNVVQTIKVSPTHSYSSENMMISRDGRNIAWFKADLNQPVIYLAYSSDWGATFSYNTLPVPAGLVMTRSTGCLPNDHRGTQHVGNLAFDDNGNLYVMYSAFQPQLNVGLTVNAGELYLLVIPPSGLIPSAPTKISDITVDLPISLPGDMVPVKFEVVQTRSHIVFSTNYGKGYNDGVSPTLKGNTPMFVIVDKATGAVSRISYGGSVNNYELGLCDRYWTGYATSFSPTSMTSDGTNIFIAPGIRSGLWNSPIVNTRVMMFSPTVGNPYVYFPNVVASAAADPMVDFDSPLLAYGTTLSSLLPAGYDQLGVHGFASRWQSSVVPRSKEQVELLMGFASTVSPPSVPRLPLERVRISHVNRGGSVVYSPVLDFPVTAIEALGFQSNLTPGRHILSGPGSNIPYHIFGSNGLVSVGGSLLTSYCQEVTSGTQTVPFPSGIIDFFGFEFS